jgi:hypothetical protein
MRNRHCAHWYLNVSALQKGCQPMRQSLFAATIGAQPADLGCNVARSDYDVVLRLCRFRE